MNKMENELIKLKSELNCEMNTDYLDRKKIKEIRDKIEEIENG